MLLGDGQVLAVGGQHEGGVPIGSAEVFDPATGAWSETGALDEPRDHHTTRLLADWNVLVAGGGRDRLAITELYDQDSGVWSTSAHMIEARSSHSATILPDGRDDCVEQPAHIDGQPFDECYGLLSFFVGREQYVGWYR